MYWNRQFKNIRLWLIQRPSRIAINCMLADRWIAAPQVEKFYKFFIFFMQMSHCGYHVCYVILNHI